MDCRSTLSPLVLLSSLASPSLALAAPPKATEGEPAATQSNFNVRTENLANLAAAEALFQEARRLADEGRYAEACPKFEESQRLDPAVGTLLYLAACYEEIGQTASAWATFELAASEGRKANQLNREKIARERAQALVGRLSKLSIVLEGEHRIDGLIIHRDKTEVGEASLSMPLPVDPGKHRVEATAPGRQPWSKEIVVGPESDSVTVVIPLLQPLSEDTVAADVVGAPTTSTDTTTPEGHAEQPSELGTQKLVGVAVGGLGVVGVGVGTWMLLDAASLETESEKYCKPPSYTSCSNSGLALLDDAEGQRNLGYVVGGVGLAALIGGAVIYFTAPSETETASTSSATIIALVDERSAGLRVSGSF